jgi:hypothetical protein
MDLSALMDIRFLGGRGEYPLQPTVSGAGNREGGLLRLRLKFSCSQEIPSQV